VRNASFQGPATVQLATSKAALVVQLSKCSRKKSAACAPILKAMFADPSIIKAGVGIDDDLLDLYHEWNGLSAVHRIDLNRIVLPGDPALSNCGLKRLAEAVLGIDLPKSKKVSASDWSQIPLLYKQVAYAARDAWVSAVIAERVICHEWKTSISEVAHMLHQEERTMPLDILCAKRQITKQKNMARRARKIVRDLSRQDGILTDFERMQLDMAVSLLESYQRTQLPSWPLQRIVTYHPPSLPMM
jgi:ribonuclease D